MMKRITSTLLSLLLLLSLCACAEGGQTATTGSDEGTFRVGYGRVDITPYEEAVPLAGYGNTSTRMSTGCADRLYTTCIAFTDAEGETVLLYTNDLTSVGAVEQDLREAVSEATGVPMDNILLAATHTHSAPDLGNTNEASILRYRARLTEWATDAALKALEDRKPATMETAATATENLNFVRHYTVSDGGTVGENFGLLGDRTYVSHCHDADPTMQLLRFKREGGKDVVLLNWQVHPTRYGNTTNASADFISPLRTRMEEKLDCHFAYFSGASGNLNPGSRITSELRTQEYNEMGQFLANDAIKALETAKPATVGDIHVTSREVTAPVDKSEVGKMADATIIRDLWQSTNDLNKCMEEANKLGLNSQWHASGVIKRCSQLGDTYSMKLYAFSIGDVAFVGAPYEMFDQNGVQIRDASPFSMTFIATLCNGSDGYVAAKECATHGCYGFDSRSFGNMGTAEELVAEYTDMLNTLHK